MVNVILGSQWGDEGKGKLIDILAPDHDIIARATGGSNAGHTIHFKDANGNDKKFIFHLLPSGMFSPNVTCVIGNGVVIHFPTLMEELKVLSESGIDGKSKLLISNRAHVVFDYHQTVDGMQEDQKGDSKVGTTKRGIGPTYTDKIRRTGVRVHELYDRELLRKKYFANLESLKKTYGEFEHDGEKELNSLAEIAEEVRPMITDSAYYLNLSIKKGKKVLVEGANGALLDIDHGTYPFVTSSNASIGGIITGTGIPATKIGQVIGIMKAYTTRVGSGPFPTELLDELGERIRNQGGEFGSTTGRPRRCGWFDSIVARYSIMINGTTSMNITKLDVLTGIETLKIATNYLLEGKTLHHFPTSMKSFEKIEVEYVEMPGWTEDITKARTFTDLPENAQNYVKKLEELCGIKASSIGVGPGREEMIFC